MPSDGTSEDGAPSQHQDPRTAEWVDDVLGPGWSQRTLEDGAESDAAATLVRRDLNLRAPKATVLYVHGFAEYFFQTHLARAWTEAGFAFYAVDLRRCGRSLRPGQLPASATDLAEYFADLDAAVGTVRAEAPGPLILLGHSMGGLVASLWADTRRGDGPDLLILNSPWLEHNGPWAERVLLDPVVGLLGRLTPRLPVRSMTPHYGRWLHRDTGGEWEYDLAWKPAVGFPARAGLARAVRRGHRAVARGLDIRCPVLVCCSDTSGSHRTYHPQLDRTDSVLDVEHIMRRAPLLGPDVAVEQIPRGVHDLALSSFPVRARYFETTIAWATERLAAS